MTLWKCYNPACSDNPAGMPGHDFAADKPVCPKCGAGDSPRTKHLVVKREVICFEQTRPGFTGIGVGYPVCNPAGKAKRRTADPPAVTCPKCLETEAYRKALAEFGGEVVEDVLAADLATGTVKQG